MSSTCLSRLSTIHHGLTDQMKENYNGMWVNLLKPMNRILSIKDKGIPISMLDYCRPTDQKQSVIGRWVQLFFQADESSCVWRRLRLYTMSTKCTLINLHAVYCRTHRSAQSNMFPRLVVAIGYLYLLKLKTESRYLIYLTYGELSRRNKHSHMPSGSQSILLAQLHSPHWRCNIWLNFTCWRQERR